MATNKQTTLLSDTLVNVDPTLHNMQKQYEAYLTRVGLVESQMHPQQRIETKRAFYGGLGVMLSIIWERPDQFAREMLNMSNQIQNFWDNETLNHLTGNNG